MTTPYYSDESVTLYLGDALRVLSSLPDESVECCVTSPPYFGLRDYGEPGQYGLESSPAEYVETMRAVFAEVRRVLASAGTLWLNLGDSYADGKNLRGIPWRVAFALQDDGWVLRNDIVWHKPNAMPESVGDRFANKHEHVFMLAKSARYQFDLDATREPIAYPNGYHALQTGKASAAVAAMGHKHHGRIDGTFDGPNPLGRNPGDVWSIPTTPFPEAHFAAMPRLLAERCVVASCSPGGLVLDPFSGSGTTGLAATKHGRHFVGIDLSRDYLDLSLRTRLAQSTLDFGEVGA